MSRRTNPRPGDPIKKVTDKSGRIRFRVVVDVAPKGMPRQQETTTHDTLSDAEQRVAEVKAGRGRGEAVGRARQTFADAADAWLHGRKVAGKRDVTIAGYRSTLRRPVEAFGGKRLSDVTSADVRKVVESVTAVGLSARTARLSLVLMRAVLADAVAEGLIPRNPAARVQAPEGESRKREPLTVEEVGKLRQTITGDRLEACWLLTLYGLRRSEVLGLRWEHVDLDAGVLRIESGRVLVDGKRTEETGKTKTKAGRRTLPIPADLRAALLRLLLAAGSSEYLATDPFGKPVRHEWWSDQWRRWCRKADVPVVTLHAARHGSVTYMIAAGVPLLDVSKWHGHDLPTMLRTYDHAPVAATVGDTLSALLTAEG